MKTSLIVIQNEADHADAKELIENLMGSSDSRDRARIIALARLVVASDRARSTFVAIGNGRPESDRRFVSGDSRWEHHHRRSQSCALARNHAKP